MHILIHKATILSPGSKLHLKKKDILIKNGTIDQISDSITSKNAKVIDQKGLMVSAGWCDIFADFCDPGFEHKETLESGMAAAAAGGYTDVCILPNTQPTTSGKSQVEYIRSKSGIVNLHPIGSISKQTDGKDLAEMCDMKLSGAAAFSDGRKPLQHSGLMLKALQYVKTFDGVLIEIPDDTHISKTGLMNEGIVSTQMGLQGKSNIAESIHLHRDIELLQYTQSRLHITGISTKQSVEKIRQAKKQGLQITCSVTPYHLLFTELQLHDYNTHFKVNPPLRTEEDRKALIKGVEDGTIDCIASHHTPQEWDSKTVEFEYAKDGMISLQTMLPMLLQVSKKISIERWVEMLTTAPRNILGISNPIIAEGERACLTVFNPNTKWMYTTETNKSKSANSPYIGTELQGKVLCTMNQSNAVIHE